MIVLYKDKKFLITDGRYSIQSQKESPNYEHITVGHDGYIAETASLLKKLAITEIAIDSDRTNYETILKLKKIMPNLQIIAKPNYIQELRLIKKAEEIKCIKKSASIAIKAFNLLIPSIKIGETEKSLADKLEHLMKNSGAENIAFDTICVSGSRTAMPHGKPTNKKISRGNLITFDFGCIWKGYACDITRTVSFGKPSSKIMEIYDVVRKAQEAGCKAIRSGVTGKYIDSICRDYITKHGYGKHFLHGTGHGLGMEVHELPYINQTNNKPLPVGAVVTCEPGIYIEGLGGVRIEDDIVVGENSSINLSSSLTRKLLII